MVNRAAIYDKLNDLPEVAEGNTERAEQRMEETICQTVAAMASLTHLPTQIETCLDSKRKVIPFHLHVM